MSFQINTHYRSNSEYDIETLLRKINLDEERKKDLTSGRGFVIRGPQSVKKDFKNPDSIYSSRFGQTLQDVNPSRYRCLCANPKIEGRLYNGTKCPICGTIVRYVGDDFGYFGWICLNDYYVIHPGYYKQIEFLIGSEVLTRIIKVEDRKDEDGFSIIASPSEKKKDEPFAGIGMISFKERFDEIMNFYLKLKPNKRSYYDDIMEGRDIVFTQSIPVYTTLLRAFRIDGERFTFEGTNMIFNLMAKLAEKINQNKNYFDRKTKPKNLLLFDLQKNWMDLYNEVHDILAKKKGRIRSSFGGRYNFTARSVIVSDPSLKIDEVKLSYHALGELLQQRIVNIIQKTFNCSYANAYLRWRKSLIKEDSIVFGIIENIIKSSEDKGVPILINRNPTIKYGGIMQMYCIGIQDDSYTMAVPLQILAPLAADFDGDTLNIHYLINKLFKEQAEEVFNPRNAMYISRNDGYFNNAVNYSKDTIINLNTLVELPRGNYSQTQIDKIRQLQACA